MPRENHIHITCDAHFTPKGVLESLRVVVPMSHAGCDFTKPKTVFVEESGICVAEYVPAHALDVEWPESVPESVPRLAVRALQGQIQLLKDELRTLRDRNDTLTTACLWAVGASAHVASPADVEKAISHIYSLKGQGLTDAKPREEAQLGEQVPRISEVLDDYEKLRDRDGVAATPVAGDARPRRWNW